HLDRALQLAGYQGLDDRQAQAARSVERELLGQSRAVVAYLDLDMSIVATEHHIDPCLSSAFGKGMVDRVLHELVQDYRERGRDLSGQLSGVALHVEPDRMVVRG